MTPGRKEQIKLTASLLNSLSSSTIVVAIVAPYIGMGMGTLETTRDLINLVALLGFGFTIGIVLHLIALRNLLNLED